MWRVAIAIDDRGGRGPDSHRSGVSLKLDRGETGDGARWRHQTKTRKAVLITGGPMFRFLGHCAAVVRPLRSSQGAACPPRRSRRYNPSMFAMERLEARSVPSVVTI